METQTAVSVFTAGGQKYAFDSKMVTDIMNLFPQTWTHFQNINQLQLMFGLKLAGINYHTDEQLAQILGGLERLGIIERDGYKVRRGQQRYAVLNA